MVNELVLLIDSELDPHKIPHICSSGQIEATVCKWLLRSFVKININWLKDHYRWVHFLLGVPICDFLPNLSLIFVYPVVVTL